MKITLSDILFWFFVICALLLIGDIIMLAFNSETARLAVEVVVEAVRHGR